MIETNIMHPLQAWQVESRIAKSDENCAICDVHLSLHHSGFRLMDSTMHLVQQHLHTGFRQARGREGPASEGASNPTVRQAGIPYLAVYPARCTGHPAQREHVPHDDALNGSPHSAHVTPFRRSCFLMTETRDYMLSVLDRSATHGSLAWCISTNECVLDRQGVQDNQRPDANDCTMLLF